MLIKFKPTTPGLRGTVLVSKKELSKQKPHKSLTRKFKSTGTDISFLNSLIIKLKFFSDTLILIFIK